MPTTHQPTPTADAATLPPFIVDPPVRKRRAYPHVPVEGDPVVRPIAPEVVSVSLFGSRAAGRSMLMDADVWDDISERFTPRWVVNVSDFGSGRIYGYVRSGANVVAGSARHKGERATASLGRLVTCARRGQLVTYADGDFLNLTLRNLRVDGKPVVGGEHV